MSFVNRISSLGDSLWIEWRIALRFLADNPLQTLLISVAISVGAAVIVFITALIMGLQSNIIEKTLGTQAHIRIEATQQHNNLSVIPEGKYIWVLENPRAQRLQTINNWQEVRDTLDKYAAFTTVSPLISGPAFAQKGTARASVGLMGIDPERYTGIIKLKDYLIEGDFSVAASDVLIGSQLADDLGLRTGDKLRLDAGDNRESVMEVAGVFELGVRELDSRYVYTSLKQAQTLLNLPGGITILELKISDVFSAEYWALRTKRLTGLNVQSWMESNAQLLNALKSQSMTTQMIRVFVALSVIFGIASVLAVSVAQRTREIGILRAMGSSQKQILRIFLWQGGVLGLAGSLLGVLVGYTLVQVFNSIDDRLFLIRLEPSMSLSAIIIATAAGVIAAMVPARRAAKYDPAVAIRYV
ncbi:MULTISPECIES: ABC transporter permease [unclassified Colwellia]|uniref:ABC transporter permease n=1 Tax=unclassified Colwellia TaxID=196834 RepID=UPI0015F4CD50|nr:MULTISPECIES: ABC transporter permease [unclassified Colwellia]MBA6233996.1 ABC transporter permease [Colwellia sp. MB02u-7]MBA6236940.1 ABC transporter permease [Colwellia sp. MB02u-11]MBA6256117.1 ABC transporter permease [Colwellia sp. MB3u-28]MBA6259348.1 ABC transporter permease [Colwellia sp. MB3u-41]MBA6300670.1 ABC transporter permease [Colwellia sp. MB3u-22]